MHFGLKPLAGVAPPSPACAVPPAAPIALPAAPIALPAAPIIDATPVPDAPPPAAEGCTGLGADPAAPVTELPALPSTAPVPPVAMGLLTLGVDPAAPMPTGATAPGVAPTPVPAVTPIMNGCAPIGAPLLHAALMSEMVTRTVHATVCFIVSPAGSEIKVHTS